MFLFQVGNIKYIFPLYQLERPVLLRPIIKCLFNPLLCNVVPKAKENTWKITKNAFYFTKRLFVAEISIFCTILFLACPLASSVPLPNLQKQTEDNVLMSAILLPLLVFP